jgi:hypothetical protein
MFSLKKKCEKKSLGRKRMVNGPPLGNEFFTVKGLSEGGAKSYLPRSFPASDPRGVGRFQRVLTLFAKH